MKSKKITDKDLCLLLEKVQLNYILERENGWNSVKDWIDVLSGGEKGRMIYGKLMLGRHNVMLMDEPTNHMDMESIESLNIALEKYAGTLIFVSHDREFVSSLATRILEIKDDVIVDFPGSYEDYLSSQGIQ
jgi:ATPase subunit of ABC transporter with duplicated ATPase domains